MADNNENRYGPRDPETGGPLDVTDHFCLSLSTLGFFGKVPKAPGTAGSIAAALIAPALFIRHPFHLKLVILAAVFVIGSLAASRAERIFAKKDPSQVVVDELLGQWVTFLPFMALEFWQVFAGFVLFRIFDILKPWPIRQAEHWLPGGWGIMIDDVFAGIYAMFGLWLLIGMV